MIDRKIKVLAIIPGAFCFGLQYVSIDLFAAAAEKIEPHFLITYWNDGVFEKLVQRKGFVFSFSWLGMFSRKLDWLNAKMSLITLGKMPRLYYDFITLVRKTNPDILFFANHHELILLMPVLVFMNRKVVCHMHDPSPAITFQKMNFILYGKRVDRFIAISNDVKKRLMELGCPEWKITVIHNGIQLPAQNHFLKSNTFENTFGWPKDSFIVGITGQMSATKGHEDLIEAFSLAVLQNSNLRLVIGGKKSEPLFSVLTEKINEHGLSDKVAFSGWVDDQADFYKAIDILVLASRHDEGYGLVVAEMMSYGKPVIITRSGGAVEIVEDGVNGYIVPKRSLVEMAQKIISLSADKSLYNTFGKNARERIVKYFNISIAAEKLVETLNEVRNGVR